MKNKLTTIILLLVCFMAFSQQLTTRTISSEYWNTLDSINQKMLILGYLMCSQAIYDHYGMLSGLQIFLHVNNTVMDIFDRVNSFYRNPQNNKVPLYQTITMAHEDFMEVQ